MMRCRSIQPLLYLHREGELTQEERTAVREHTAVCPDCRRLLEQLVVMYAVLGETRPAVPEIPGGEALIDETMGRLSDGTIPVPARVSGRGIRFGLEGWLRPALGALATAMIMLLVAQQAWDAVRIVKLEHRLHSRGEVGSSSRQTVGSEALLRACSELSEPQRRGLFGLPPERAGLAVDPMDMVRSTVHGLFGPRTGLIEELSRRYPDLAGVTLDDGLDDRERNILATEGRAFLKECEQLILEGEQKP